MIEENQNIEYKESWHDEYLKWVCGFANAKGGKIYIGITDDKQIVGVDNSKKLMEDIPNKIANQLGIIADVNLLSKDNHEYIEIIVKPSNVPISIHGKYHYRSGSTKQELRGTALQQFMLEKIGKQWDDMVNESATIDDIDEKAVSYFIKKGVNSKRLTADSLGDTTQDILDNLHLIDEDGHLKNSAILLFAKCPQKFFPGIQFRIGRFGKDETDLIIQDTIEGNLIQMADRVMEVLKSKYLTSPIHYEGMQRIEPLEIPENAFREVLYNAIVHRQYPGTAIQMRVYTEQIEMWNIGGLPLGYTIETLFQKHASQARNENIAQAFYKAGFIETWGRGIKKICDGFSEAGFEPPLFEENSGGILVTIKRKNIFSNVGSLSVDVSSFEKTELSERQRNICSLIKDDPHISATQMSVVLSIGKRTIERELAFLQKNNVIRHKGNTSAGRWILLKI